MELWHHVYSCVSQHREAELISIVEASEAIIQIDDTLADNACKLVSV